MSGRGRPRKFDEDRLLGELPSPDAIYGLRQPLEAAGVTPRAADAVVNWLVAKKLGHDPRVDRTSEFRYRTALAKMAERELTPPRGRRARVRGARGALDPTLAAALAAATVATTAAVAAVGPLGLLLAPIILDRDANERERLWRGCGELGGLGLAA